MSLFKAGPEKTRPAQRSGYRSAIKNLPGRMDGWEGKQTAVHYDGCHKRGAQLRYSYHKKNPCAKLYQKRLVGWGKRMQSMWSIQLQLDTRYPIQFANFFFLFGVHPGVFLILSTVVQTLSPPSQITLMPIPPRRLPQSTTPAHPASAVQAAAPPSLPDTPSSPNQLSVTKT